MVILEYKRKYVLEFEYVQNSYIGLIVSFQPYTDIIR